jgi:hypothetical protein
MKRNVHKRIDLNEYEANLLRMKSQKANMKEAQYLRELITGACPVEAPGKEFYEAMNAINKIGVNINQVAMVANANGYVTEEDAAYLKEQAAIVQKQMLEVKEIVLRARPYANTYYEKLLQKQKEARLAGQKPPEFGADLTEHIVYKEEPDGDN